ncbi:hypothetical protein EON62_02845, partial [archaeon]
MESVRYGPTGSEFNASGCVLSVPHTQVHCGTVVGAGAGLTWSLVIDGQHSVSPSTSYGRPEVHSFSGRGAVNASTDGGDEVVLHGTFFSVEAHLQRVTYGPSGVEYTPRCHISVPHTEITCITVPGTGRVLTWLVTVGGQTSMASEATTSYAAPRIDGMTPSAADTPGGDVVTLTG